MLPEKTKSILANWNPSDYGLAWILFFSIFYQKLAPIGFIFWLITIYKTWEIKSIDTLFKRISAGNTKWFIAYYLLLIIGFIWTENISFGLSKLENKLTFLLFPILYFGSNLKSNQNHWKLIILSSLTVSLTVNEISAIVKTFDSTAEFSWAYFYDSRFCQFMHRSYYAAYLIIGIIFLMEMNLKKLILRNILLIIFFAIGVFQTLSKIGIILLVCIFVVYTIMFLIKKASKKVFLAVITILVFISLIFVFKQSPVRTRFETVLSSLENIKLKNNPSIESNAARLIMWNTSFLVIGQNWLLGTGTGDYNDVLTNMNKKLNNSGVAHEELNSHNQFLNAWVQLGIFGLFILIMIFISSFIANGNNLSGILILLTFLINFLVESFLETQSGIILFCILLTLLFKEPKIQITKTEPNN
jgi:O-antigen ligase